MRTRTAVGVDVGGTKIATALVDENGLVLKQDTRLTPVQGGVDAVLNEVASSIQVVTADVHEPLLGVGIGCPGPVDFDRGISLFAVNMGVSWQNIHIAERVAQRLHFDGPILVENDVNAGAYGERWFGVARLHRDFVYITVGTGIGGAAFVNGKMLRGVSFSAMEVGHISTNLQGRIGDLGLRGSPEIYASGKGLKAGVIEYLKDYPASILNGKSAIETRDILDAAGQNDPLAIRVIREASDSIATVLSWCITILNPSAVVIGGGLGEAMRGFLDQWMLSEIQQRIIPDLYKQVEFAYSEVETSALGPAAVVFQHVESNNIQTG